MIKYKKQNKMENNRKDNNLFQIKTINTNQLKSIKIYQRYSKNLKSFTII